MAKPERTHYSRLLQFCQKHVGLLFLLLFLLLTTFTNLPKPNHWLAGWDNFSVSLNLPLNIWRTFFATWREYRGFGVPSDSEVVDVFRQLPLLGLSWLLPNWTLEWIYYFGMYWLGAIGAFFLTKTLAKTLLRGTTSAVSLQIAGLVGALAYATNLYTIDVFYFPITLYVVRHGFLPWILWTTHQLLTDPKPSKRLWLGFSLCILFASPGALTATVFFITALLLGCLLLFVGSWRRKLQVGLLLIALQLFWLAPFANYFLHKSSQITHASTFVPINEILLNQPFERFSFDRLLTFSADFTAGSPFKDTSHKPIVTHPGLSFTPIGKLPPLGYWSLWIPASIGLLILLTRQIQQRRFNYLWIVGVLLIGVFLLRKEYLPTGPAFEWLNTHLPLLAVVLRFGGTKLNPLLILNLSLLSGLAAAQLFTFTQKFSRTIWRSSLQLLLSLSCILAVGWMGWYPATGSLYFRIFSVEFPEAYFQAATTINADPTYGRVLQLPYGLHSYWRSHTFGYYGSSFMAFLLQKPLQDKTFNPGNLDHNSFDTALAQIIANASQLTSPALTTRATEFADFLARTNTTFILWDPTVDTHIRTQGLITWEAIPTADTNALIQALIDTQQANILGEYQLPGWAQPALASETTLKVVKLATTQAIIDSPTAATAIDPTLTNVFISSLNTLPTTLIQSNQLAGRSYPWWQSTRALTAEKQHLELTLPIPPVTTQWTLTTPATQPESDRTYVGVDVLAAYVKGKLNVYFRPTPLPFTTEIKENNLTPYFTAPITLAAWNNTVLNSNFDRYLNNWYVLGNHQTNQFRLAISDQVIPLPADLAEQPSYLASLSLPISDLAQLPVSLLIADPASSERRRQFSGDYFSLTTEPNCWLDRFTDFSHSFSTSFDGITASTTHGSLCFSTTIDLKQPTQEITTNTTKTPDQRRYFELEFTPQISNTANHDSLTQFPLLKQQRLQATQLAQPTLSELFICLTATKGGDCLNQQRFLKSTAPTPIRITSHRLFAEPTFQILMVLPTFATETQQLKASDISLIGFSPVLSAYAPLNPSDYLHPPTTTLTSNTLSIPYFLSASSLYTNPAIHGIQVENRSSCRLDTGDFRATGLRHISTTPENNYQIYLDNCTADLSYTLPYFPSNAYWWSVNYQRLAGGQPRFLADSALFLSTEFLGLNQGYPFTTTAPPTASQLIPPQGKSATDLSETFTISQYSANQSALTLGQTTIFPIPFNWQNSYLETTDSAQQFAQLTVTEPKQLLPSLWSVRLTKPLIDENTPNPRFLLTFNQGFDTQWVLLHGWHRVPADHLKVNGWANGWLITDADLPADGTYHLLYVPELLNIAGWTVTLTTLTLILGLNLKHLHPSLPTLRKKRLTKMVITALQKSIKDT